VAEWRCGPNCSFWYWYEADEVHMCAYKDDEVEQGSLCCASLDQWTTERTLLDDAIAARKGINPARAQAVEELVKAAREAEAALTTVSTYSYRDPDAVGGFGEGIKADTDACAKAGYALRAALARLDAGEKEVP